VGVNNRQRRAAKRRKRSRGRTTGAHGSARWWGDDVGPADERSLAADLVLQAYFAARADLSVAGEYARLLTSPGCGVAPAQVGVAVGRLLSPLLVTDLDHGWTPADLGQVVRRRLTAGHLPVLAAALAAEAQRHPPGRVSPEWRDELTGLGPAGPADPTSTAGLELMLGLCAVLGSLPAVETVLPPLGSTATADHHPGATDARQLARVRALLAKAESTEYDDEAEALSAKAQELISRYALGRLLDEHQHPGGRQREETVVVRRLWIEAPYVVAKALLVDAVASANRCRSVLSEDLGFCTVIGSSDDLDGVELLATSLLVQADTAMLRCGRHTDRRGMSRTTSFRRSFLVAYASRIGERLRAATAAAADQVPGAGALVPLLARRAERVQATRDRLFPELVTRATAISNGAGWAAGRAAADLALLDGDLRPLAEADAPVG